MQLHTSSPERASTLDGVLACLEELILDYLNHGFFDLAIECEMVSGRKRRLVIKAGKSCQFTIPEDELRRR